jgi:hypothetical protein
MLTDVPAREPRGGEPETGLIVNVVVVVNVKMTTPKSP